MHYAVGVAVVLSPNPLEQDFGQRRRFSNLPR